MSLPDLSEEQKYWKTGFSTVAGVDEVGRGCIAGPVVAVAVFFPSNHICIPGVNDSKKLSGKNRERLEPLIRAQATCVGVGVVDSNLVDTLGIVQAVSSAMRQAVLVLPPVDALLIDGPLDLGLSDVCTTYQTIIRGDSHSYSIAAASIIAKVYRDSLMKKLSCEYPAFKWDHNKGYGTAEHYAAIKQYGITPLHRKSFLSYA